MSLPAAVSEFCRVQGWGKIVLRKPVPGGCINHGARLTTTDGHRLFLKTNPQTPTELFAREAEGLSALRATGAVRLPEPLLHGPDFLMLEYLPSAAPSSDYWECLGEGLARLHLVTSERFGFAHDNFIGSTPQPNPWIEDGYEFFAQHRLLFQAKLAREQGLLSAEELRSMEWLAGRLKELIPSQPASLIHGDLWGGNVMSGPVGEPALIDPAAHYGWAEAELGMTVLFGRFPDSCYSAYQSVRPLDPGWNDRLDIYNLYHLLNHLNLFAGGYHVQVAGILRRYS